MTQLVLSRTAVGQPIVARKPKPQSKSVVPAKRKPIVPEVTIYTAFRGSQKGLYEAASPWSRRVREIYEADASPQRIFYFNGSPVTNGTGFPTAASPVNFVLEGPANAELGWGNYEQYGPDWPLLPSDEMRARGIELHGSQTAAINMLRDYLIRVCRHAKTQVREWGLYDFIDYNGMISQRRELLEAVDVYAPFWYFNNPSTPPFEYLRTNTGSPRKPVIPFIRPNFVNGGPWSPWLNADHWEHTFRRGDAAYGARRYYFWWPNLTDGSLVADYRNIVLPAMEAGAKRAGFRLA